MYYFRLRFLIHSDIRQTPTTCSFCYQLGELCLPVSDLPQTVFQPSDLAPHKSNLLENSSSQEFLMVSLFACRNIWSNLSSLGHLPLCTLPWWVLTLLW